MGSLADAFREFEAKHGQTDQPWYPTLHPRGRGGPKFPGDVRPRGRGGRSGKHPGGGKPNVPGKVDLPDGPFPKLSDVLDGDKRWEVGDVGVDSWNAKHFVTDKETGRRYIVKATASKAEAERELVAADMKEAVGLPTYQVQAASDDAKPWLAVEHVGDSTGGNLVGSGITPADPEEWKKLVDTADLDALVGGVLFDFLTGEEDRHTNNWMVVDRDGVSIPMLVDHGHSFKKADPDESFLAYQDRVSAMADKGPQWSGYGAFQGLAQDVARRDGAEKTKAAVERALERWKAMDLDEMFAPRVSGRSLLKGPKESLQARLAKLTVEDIEAFF